MFWQLHSLKKPPGGYIVQTRVGRGYRALADYSAKKGEEVRLLTAQLQG